MTWQGKTSWRAVTEQDVQAWQQRTATPHRHADVPESRFLGQVRQLAMTYGYLAYHTYDSRKSARGYPDMTLVKPGRLIFAELKRPRGKVTQPQAVWLDVLRHSVPGVEVYCWYPADLETIVDILSAKARPPCPGP